MHNSTLVCFGEVLWDVLPSGKMAGGAPMNVAFQASNLGLSARMISRVGTDELGTELLNFLNAKGVSTQYVQTDPTLPTGAVHVTLNSNGSPAYKIVQPVAWDNILPDAELHDLVMEADAFVFGSLVCRSERSKKTLLELLEVATLRVFDTNLRSPFYAQGLLDELLLKADIVKLNDEELSIIASWNGVQGEEATLLHFLKEKYRLDMLILTKGDKGAVCLDETDFYTHPGFKVSVKDTIGSGDAFLAAFLSKMLGGAGTRECLEFACALGALVATKQGGTPDINKLEIQQCINSLQNS